MQVKIKLLSESAKTPTFAHKGDAGADLYVSRIDYDYANEITTYHSDVAFEIPEGHVGLMFSRSSIYKTGQAPCNAVGVIDSGYRGEVSMRTYMVASDVDNAISYKEGDRFAQLVIMPIPAIEFVESDELSDTDRGAGGYGSTGR